MKKVLIISYYYPPCNAVASARPYSWVTYFEKHSIQTTLLTRQWKGNESEWNDYIEPFGDVIQTNKKGNHTEILLPYRPNRLNKIAQEVFGKIGPLRKLLTILYSVLGHFQTEINGYFLFKNFLKEHLKSESYDAVLITVPPHNLVRLGAYIKKKHNIKFILDYRDLWDNDELNPDYSPGFSKSISNRLIKFYLRKWTSHASFISVISNPMIPLVNKLSPVAAIEVTNGFEHELYGTKETALNPLRNKKFTISVVGLIYPKQNISILLGGLIRFLKTKSPEDVQIRLIGIEAVPIVASQFKNGISPDFLYTTPRIERSKAINETLSSDVLAYPGWKGYKGIYSGKIFDYLGARRNILIAPGDKDVIDEIVLKTNAGKIAHSLNDCSEILESWYNEWRKNGYLEYKGILAEIMNHSRENQADKMATELLKHLPR